MQIELCPIFPIIHYCDGQKPDELVGAREQHIQDGPLAQHGGDGEQDAPPC